MYQSTRSGIQLVLNKLLLVNYFNDLPIEIRMM